MEISVTLHNSEVPGYQKPINDKSEIYTKKDIFVSSESEDYLTVSEDDYSKTRNSGIPESEVSHVFKNSTFKLAFQGLPYDPESDTDRETENHTFNLNVTSSPFHIKKSSSTSYDQQPATFLSRTVDLNKSDKKLEPIPISDLDTLDIQSRQVLATDLDNIPYKLDSSYIPVTNLDTLGLNTEQHKSDNGESRLEYFKEMTEEEAALPPPLEFSDGTVPKNEKMETGDLVELHPIENHDDGEVTTNRNGELQSRLEEDKTDPGFMRDGNSEFDIPNMAYISEMTMTNESIEEQHFYLTDEKLHGFGTNDPYTESLPAVNGQGYYNVMGQFELSARPYIVHEGDIPEEAMMSKGDNQVIHIALNDDYIIENEPNGDNSGDHGKEHDNITNTQISVAGTIIVCDTLTGEGEDSAMAEQELDGNLFGDKHPVDSDFYVGDYSMQQSTLDPKDEREDNGDEREDNGENHLQTASSRAVEQFEKASAVIVMENSFSQVSMKSNEVSQKPASQTHPIQTLHRKVYLHGDNGYTKDDEMVPVRVERKVDLPGYPLEMLPDSHPTTKPKPSTQPKFPGESSASSFLKEDQEKERPEVCEEVIEPIHVKNGKSRNLVNVIHVMSVLKSGLKEKEMYNSSEQQAKDSEFREIEASEDIKINAGNGHDTVVDTKLRGKDTESSKQLSQISVRNGNLDSLSSWKSKSESIHGFTQVPKTVGELNENQKMDDEESQLKIMEEETSKLHLGTSVMHDSQDLIVDKPEVIQRSSTFDKPEVIHRSSTFDKPEAIHKSSTFDKPEVIHKSSTFDHNKSSIPANSTEGSRMKYSTSISVSKDSGKETFGDTNTPFPHIKPLTQVKPLSFSLKSLPLSRPVKYNTPVNTGVGVTEKITSQSASLSLFSVLTPAKTEYPIKRMETMPFEISILKGILGIGIKVHVTPEGYVQVMEILPSGPVGREGNIRVGDYLLSINNAELTGLPDGKVQQILRLLPRGLSKIVASASPPISEQTAPAAPEPGGEVIHKPLPSPRKPKSLSLHNSPQVDNIQSFHEQQEIKLVTNSGQSAPHEVREEIPSSPRQQSSPSLPQQPPVPTRRKQTPSSEKPLHETSSGPSGSSSPTGPQESSSSFLSSPRTASEPPLSLAKGRGLSKLSLASGKTLSDVLDDPVITQTDTRVNLDFPKHSQAAIIAPLFTQQAKTLKSPPLVAPKPKRILSGSDLNRGESKESKVDQPSELWPIEAEVFVSVSHPSQLMQPNPLYDRKSVDVLPGQVNVDYVSSLESGWTQGEVSSRKGKTEDGTVDGTDSHNVACSQENVFTSSTKSDDKGNNEGNAVTGHVSDVLAHNQNEKIARNSKASENVSVVTPTVLHENIITENVSFTNHLLLPKHASDPDERNKSYFSDDAFRQEGKELLIDLTVTDSMQPDFESVKEADDLAEIHPLHIGGHDDSSCTHTIPLVNNVDGHEENSLIINHFKNQCGDLSINDMNIEKPLVSQDLTPLESPQAVCYFQSEKNDLIPTAEFLGTDSDFIVQSERFLENGEVKKYVEKIVSDAILAIQPELQLSTLENMSNSELFPFVDHSTRLEESSTLHKENLDLSYCDGLNNQIVPDSTDIVDFTCFELCSQPVYHTLKAANPHSAINELLDMYGESSDLFQNPKNYQSTYLTGISFDEENNKSVEKGSGIPVISENNEGYFQITNMSVEPMVVKETMIGTDTVDIVNGSQTLLPHTDKLDNKKSFSEQANQNLPIIPQLVHASCPDTINSTVFDIDDSVSLKQVETGQGPRCLEFPDKAVTDVIFSYANIKKDLREKQNKGEKEMERNICSNTSVTGEMTAISKPFDKEELITEFMQPKGDNTIQKSNAEDWTKMLTKDEKSKENENINDGNKCAEPASKSTSDDHQRIDVDRMIRMLSADHEDKPQGEGQILQVTMMKGVIGLGFVIEGGKQSPRGDLPLMIRKIFKGGPAEQCGLLKIKDEILSVNGEDVTSMRHSEAWNHLKFLPDGEIKLVIRRYT